MTLRTKVVLGICLILALIVAGYAWVARRFETAHRVAAARREADLIASVAERAVSIAMESGKSDETQELLERMSAGADGARLRILAVDGRVRRSSVPQEVGLSSPVARLPGESVQHLERIRNQPKCAGCHANEGDTLGILSVEQRVNTADAAGDDPARFLLLSGTVGLAASGVLIALLFTFLVGRRVESLSVSMRRVETGDLTARATDESRDELGRLGRSFNVMVARLAEEQRRREAEHDAEIRRTGQLAALGKMAAIGRMSSGIAHEINNPLNNISLSVEALVEDYKRLSDEERWTLLQDISFETERASEIVRSLLDFSRHELPQMAPVDLASLLHATSRLLTSEMEHNNVVLVTETPEGLPGVQGSPSLLRQAFLNLMLNAIQAMPSGGKLTVRARAVDGDRLEIEVQDEGAGMTPEVAGRIFEPFFTTKEPGQGTGLGLWVTYSIISKHGGEIGVTSKPGEGTTFRVVLQTSPGGS